MADDMKLQIMLEAINDTGPGMDALLKSVEDIAKNVRDMSKSFGDFFKTIPSGMESVTRAVEEVNAPLDSANKALTSLYEEASKGETAAAGLAPMENEVKKIKETIVATEDELRKLTDLSSIKTSTGGAVDASMLSASQLAGLYGKQSGQNVIVPGGKKEGGGGGIFSNEGSMNLMYAGMTLGAAALPVDAGLKAAISQYGQFSQAMANVNSMANMSTQQLAQLSQQVMNLSKAVPIGPVQLANALYGVVGAGVPAADAMNFLKTAADASVAGQVDLTTATNALVYVMGSYGLQAKDMTKVSDEMFAANAAGAMTFQQFASSLGTVAGAAAQAGVPFNQIAAATAALTNDGISAQRATLGLRALLMGIVAPTKGATKEAKALGIEWDQNALKSKGLTGMLQEAMQATHGNAQELKKLIPNIAGWTVAVDLGGKGAQSFKNAMDQMNHSTGATARAMQAQQQGFEQQMNTMKAAVQSASIAFAGTLAPAITKVANTISNLAKWFSNLSPSTQKFIGDGAAAAAVFLTLGAGALMFLSGIGQAKLGLATLTELFGPAITKFKEFALSIREVGLAESIQAASTKVAAAAQVAFNAIMDANPIAIVILAVTALIGIIALLATHWKQVTAWMEQHWGINVPQIMRQLQKVFTTVWNAIKAVVTVVWEYFKTFFEVYLVAMKVVWETIWQAILLVVKVVFDAIVGAIRTNFDLIKGIFRVVTDLLTGQWGKAWTDMKSTLGKVWGDIKGMFGNMLNDALDFGRNFVEMVAKGIENAIGSVRNAASHVASTIKSFLGFHSPTEQGPGAEADQWMPNMMKMFVQGIQAHIPQLQATLQGALGSPFQGASAMVSGSMSQSMVLSGGGSAGMASAPVYITVQGSVIKERELVDIVQRGQWSKLTRLNKF